QQRLERVRRYQLTNPEAATEAMNRLAQAFVCLTDAQARRDYDRSLYGDAAEPEPEPPRKEEVPPRPNGHPQPRPAGAGTPPPVPEAPPEPPDPMLEAARSSRSARRGLGTKRALYYRMARTRALLRAWDQAGKYLNHPERRLKRPAEARELLERLSAIRELL